jgi:bifunctional non-homologous end joining protein LigD
MSRVSSKLRFIEPQIPTLTEQPPGGPGWIHEVKHDGYRTLLLVERGRATAHTRKGFDWSDRYSGIIAAAAGLPCRSAILDGEVIVQDERGASDFEALQLAIRFRPQRLIFYAFDLLHLNGKDLCDRPLLERRAKLRSLLGENPASPLQYSEEFTGDAAVFFNACARHELEGIVSKRATAPYRSGRSKTWLKTKCFAESEFILLGVDRDRKTGAARALLAKAEEGGLIYAGTAFVALTSEAREELNSKLEVLAQELPAISGLTNREARWVRPELALRVRHLVVGKFLRHATVREICG